MHCNICDKQLGEKELSWNSDIGTYDPCVTCMEIIMEAAFSDGYSTEDDKYVVIESSLDEQRVEDGVYSLGTWTGGADRPDE